jgi:hypothetical protein
MNTSRKDYLVCMSLATTYALIGTLPDECQEKSDRDDIAEILQNAYGPKWAEIVQHKRHVLSEDEWQNGLRPLRGVGLRVIENALA